LLCGPLWLDHFFAFTVLATRELWALCGRY
jgi:hypothetical protein